MNVQDVLNFQDDKVWKLEMVTFTCNTLLKQIPTRSERFTYLVKTLYSTRGWESHTGLVLFSCAFLEKWLLRGYCRKVENRTTYKPKPTALILNSCFKYLFWFSRGEWKYNTTQKVRENFLCLLTCVDVQQPDSVFTIISAVRNFSFTTTVEPLLPQSPTCI